MKHRPYLPFAPILSISIVLLGISCKKGPTPPAAPSGFEKSFTITLTNSLDKALPNQAVVIPVGHIAPAVADFNPGARILAPVTIGIHAH